jgi:tetratricopeptide (TPR) repeat protein
MRRIFAIFFISICTLFYGQEGEAIKQLKAKLGKHPDKDTTRASLLNELSWEYAFFDPHTSIKYAHEAIALSKKTNFPDGEAFAYNTLGDDYRSLSLYDSAFYYFDEALKIRTLQKKKHKVIAVLINMANVYTQQKQYANAIIRYNEAIKLAKEIDYKKALAVTYTNLADAYRAIGYYDKGMKTLSKALEVNKAINDTLQAPYIYAALAQLQHEMGNSKNAIDNARTSLRLLNNRPDLYLKTTVIMNMGSYFGGLNMADSALGYYLRAIEYTHQIQDSIGLGVAVGNVAGVYLGAKKPAIAVQYSERARAIAINIHDTALYYNNTINIANAHALNKDYAKALSYALEALPLVKRANIKNDLYGCYKTLSQIHKGLNQHDKRADFLELAVLYKDSLMSEENNKTAARLNVQFDVFGKEKEIELLNKSSELREVELAKQKSARNFITGIAALFGLIVLVIIFFYIKIRKSNIIINKQKQRVEAQNEIISKQKHFVEEKQKEVMDSIHYAKRIQRSLLPTEVFIDRIIRNLKK